MQNEAAQAKNKVTSRHSSTHPIIQQGKQHVVRLCLSSPAQHVGQKLELACPIPLIVGHVEGLARALSHTASDQVTYQLSST